MPTYACPRCADLELQAFDDASGAQVWFCAQCRGTFCQGPETGLWLGAELSALAEAAPASPLEQLLPEPMLLRRLRCPTDGDWLRVTPTSHSADGVRHCGQCGALFLDAGVLPKLRANIIRRRPSTSLSLPLERPRSLGDSEPGLADLARSSLGVVVRTAQGLLEGDTEAEPELEAQRIPFSNPWADILTVPLALLWMSLVATTELGRVLLYMVQLQFHELGHAVPAWLSGRAALPLPFGFTFWKQDRSVFVGLLVTSLIGVLLYRGWLERRRFPVLVGTGLLALQGLFSLLLSEESSMMLMILGGIAGEIILSSFVMIAFFFPVLDRLRWDFFRFLLLFPAAGAWVATTKLWLEIRHGSHELPMGSILGAAGDGSGDLDRLVQVYGFTRAGITTMYMTMIWLSALALLVVYGFFAVRSLRVLRAL